MGEMEIRYTLTARQKLFFVPVWLIATGERFLLGDAMSSIVWAGVTFWSAFFLVKARRSTTLTPYGLVIWNYKTTRIPWTAITAVEVGRGPLLSDFVKLRLADGKEMILRAPQAAPLQRDPQFAVKAGMIRAWWRLHSGRPVEPEALADADLGPGVSLGSGVGAGLGPGLGPEPVPSPFRGNPLRARTTPQGLRAR